MGSTKQTNKNQNIKRVIDTKNKLVVAWSGVWGQAKYGRGLAGTNFQL